MVVNAFIPAFFTSSVVIAGLTRNLLSYKVYPFAQEMADVPPP
jgi:hypothetical protein